MTREEWEFADAGRILGALCEAGCSKSPTMRRAACWHARQVWHPLADPRSHAAVQTAERYTRGEATAEQLAVAGVDAWAAYLDTYDDHHKAVRAAHADTKYLCRRPDRTAYGDARDPAIAVASITASWATSRAVDSDSFDNLYGVLVARYWAAERWSAARAEAVYAAQAAQLRELIPWDAVAPLFAAALSADAA